MTFKSRNPTLNLIGKKKKKVSHAECEMAHFKKRMFERVGYWITDDQYNELCKLTQSHGKFAYKGDRGSVFYVMWRDIELKVVFNISNYTLITVLPK